MNKAKIELKFKCETGDDCSTVIDSINGKIRISTEDNEDSENYEHTCILLDIPTAIRYVKTLRSEIAKIKEGGGNNG